MINPDDTTGAIRFTEYVLPRGEKRDMHVKRPFAITQKAKHILGLGYKFEAEILTTGQVSLTIAGKNTDVGIEICNNGPEVLDAVDRLIMEFNEERAKKMDEASACSEEINMTDNPDLARNVKLHNAWIEATVRRVVGEMLSQGYVQIGEVSAIEAEKRARENFEMALGVPPGSFKTDGGH